VILSSYCFLVTCVASGKIDFHVSCLLQLSQMGQPRNEVEQQSVPNFEPQNYPLQIIGVHSATGQMSPPPTNSDSSEAITLHWNNNNLIYNNQRRDNNKSTFSRKHWSRPKGTSTRSNDALVFHPFKTFLMPHFIRTSIFLAKFYNVVWCQDVIVSKYCHF
jgi:hypothetical protein